MTAALARRSCPHPGQRYYASHEEYLFALAEELRKEYEIIASHGLTLQLGLP